VAGISTQDITDVRDAITRGRDAMTVIAMLNVLIRRSAGSPLPMDDRTFAAGRKLDRKIGRV
jgi:hypothetical protein